jgi:hypothetical protein
MHGGGPLLKKVRKQGAILPAWADRPRIVRIRLAGWLAGQIDSWMMHRHDWRGGWQPSATARKGAGTLLRRLRHQSAR